jgi:hypothetical protein
MQPSEFYNLIEGELIPKCMEIMKSKGEAYSGRVDKLGNFKRIADMANLHVLHVWFTYFVKHFDALTAYIRGEYKDSESIDGRIMDMVNYLFLLYAILHEVEIDGRSIGIKDV